MLGFEEQLVREDPTWPEFKENVRERLAQNTDLSERWQSRLQDTDARGRIFAFTALNAVLDLRQLQQQVNDAN